MSQDFDARTIVAGAVAGLGRIRLELPGREPFEAELVHGVMVVGRGQEADLVVDQASVSRRHAALEVVGGRLRVSDLGSANGVELDGRRVATAELEPGQGVRLGEVALTLLGLESPAQAPADFQPSQATRVQASAAPRPAGSGKGKRLAMIGGVSAAVVVTLIVLVSWLGGSKPAPPPESTTPRPAAQQPASAPAQAPAAAPAPAAPAASPEEAQRRLRDGQTFYEAGRLPDAAAEWRRALEIDPGLEAARLKLARVEQEILAQAEEAFRVGLQSFNYLNYEAAIQNWQRVLNLAPDPQNPLHQKTLDYIAQARAKLGR